MHVCTYVRSYLFVCLVYLFEVVVLFEVRYLFLILGNYIILPTNIRPVFVTSAMKVSEPCMYIRSLNIFHPSDYEIYVPCHIQRSIECAVYRLGPRW